MKAFLSLIVVVLLLNLLSVGAILEETCKQAAAQPDVKFDFNFCITTLQVVPGSVKADTLGLATIAANLANTNITHNLSKVNELLSSKSVSNESKQSLLACQITSNLGCDDTKEAIEALGSHDIWTATHSLGALENNVESCIDSWNEGKQESLMATEDDDALKISNLAFSLTALLKH